MKFYKHFINPHDSHEHHDLRVEGCAYGVHRHEEPAISPHTYEFLCDIEDTAIRFIRHLERLPESTWDKKFPKMRITADMVFGRH